jgi:uncharacterized membrane protein
LKITEDQIQELYNFTRKHFVEHYDLQTELVDHLANGIEELWQANPEMSFKEARLREFRKFGVCGFSDVIQKRQWAMEKRYYKYIYKFCREYFKLPKAILFFGITAGLFALLNFFSAENKIYVVVTILIAAFIVMAVRGYKNRKAYQRKIGLEKRWMLEEKIYHYSDAIQMLIFPINFLHIFVLDTTGFSSSSATLIISFLTVLYLTIGYVMTYVIPEKAQELLNEVYPEYKIA